MRSYLKSSIDEKLEFNLESNILIIVYSSESLESLIREDDWLNRLVGA